MRRHNLERLYWMAQRYQKAGRTGMVVGIEQILELFQQIEILERKLKQAQNRRHLVPRDKPGLDKRPGLCYTCREVFTRKEEIP